jgi:hypothetical protein
MLGGAAATRWYGRRLPVRRAATHFDRRTVDELAVGDEPSFCQVALYADLKEVLRRAAYAFRVMPKIALGLGHDSGLYSSCRRHHL